MKHIKLYESFNNEERYSGKTAKDLTKFLDTFPDNATNWGQATQELSDMYHWMTEMWNEENEDNTSKHLKPVGVRKMKTPSEFNTKFKAAILKAFDLFDDRLKKDFFERFGEWF